MRYNSTQFKLSVLTAICAWMCAASALEAASLADLVRSNDVRGVKAMILSNRKSVLAARTESGSTPLHWAAETDQAEAAELLLNHGADKSARTDGGWTPLHSAAAKGSTNVIALLLKRRAPVNAISQSGTPLDLAKGYKQPAAAALIEAKRGRAGREVSIHMAAAKGDAVAVQAFIRRGANVNSPGPLHQSTPLHWAAGAGKVNTMEVLISLGADVDALSDSNATMTTKNDRPLMMKQAAVPRVASVTPARSGPMTLARLNWIEFRAMALGRLSLGTSEGMSD